MVALARTGKTSQTPWAVGASVGIQPPGGPDSSTRPPALNRYGCTVSPPHASGATSVSVSVKVHWWPNGSAALY
jgi:hypothetical protein